MNSCPMLSNEDRIYILKEFLRLIDQISDKDFQARVWIGGEGPECIDFDETVNYFLFEGLDIIDHYQEYEITESQHKLLENFRIAFESFADEHNWPHLFINTPEWSAIRELASQVLKAFNYKRDLPYC